VEEFCQDQEATMIPRSMHELMIVMNIWCRYYKNIQLVFREQQLQEDNPTDLTDKVGLEITTSVIAWRIEEKM